MTTTEIISGIETLNAEVVAVKLAAERAGKNPSWLMVARGALLKAIEQIELHQRNVENPPAAPAGENR